MPTNIGLGRGLSSLIPNRASGEAVTPLPSLATNPAYVAVTAIDPNPKQPRFSFDPARLTELAESIKAHGILEPLVVQRKSDGRFELIAGERRLRAAKLIGLLSVPVVVRSGDDDPLMLALIENVQREDLNPIERAMGYEKLIKSGGLTQEEVAKRVGKARPSVANTLRLLSLPAEIQRAVSEGVITEAAAKEILTKETAEEQLAFFREIVAGRLSTTEVRKATAVKRSYTVSDPRLKGIAEELTARLGQPVSVAGTRKKGTIQIRFSSEEELLRITEQLKIEE
ncbi:MAG: ParB/RepB/Spo0J family partition protein [Parcubacteria group bacterium]|nr:ParB/RepB/Spo0J family partition protein [Parcubacteria group bacterium]